MEVPVQHLSVVPLGPYFMISTVISLCFMYKTSKGTKNNFGWVKEHVYIVITAVQGKPENVNFVSRMVLALSRGGGL